MGSVRECFERPGQSVPRHGFGAPLGVEGRGGVEPVAFRIDFEPEHRRLVRYGCDVVPEYVEIARERLRQLEDGTLRTRPMGKPVYDPRLPRGGH